MATSKTTLDLFQAATSRSELARLLKVKTAALTYLLYVETDAVKYQTFTIPKKRGGTRQIHAPNKKLKSLQRRVAGQIERCIADIQQKSGRKNKSSHGFTPGKSILTNASVHRNKRYVFNLDLADFFPTISGSRIRGVLINDRNFKLSPVVATTLAHIACRNGVLPQGSPCSPVLSNLVAGILDVHLSKLAKNAGCLYTRYADDLTFSTNKREFPSDIARLDAEGGHRWVVGGPLLEAIHRSGFSVNDAKTRMQYAASRQEVTGLIVNKRVNVPNEYRRLVRAYVFSLINHGKFYIKSATKDEAGAVVEDSVEGTRAQLHGMLGFIHSVDNVLRTDQRKHPFNYPRYLFETKKDKPTGNLAVYRKFLLYTRFYANELPLVVCEGKTDNVYISNAAHQLKASFPALVKHDAADGKDVLSFKLFKYARQHRKKQHVYMPNFSTASILGAGSGGCPNLANLMRAYQEGIRDFKAPIGRHPVLFVVDNDDGGKAVFNMIKKTFGLEVDRSKPFTHIFANVYIVPVSLQGQVETSIEDLFDRNDVAKGLNGKPFDFTNTADRTTTFGKEAFAYQFVAKHAATLDWKNFIPLLAGISDAMADYNQRIAAA